MRLSAVNIFSYSSSFFLIIQGCSNALEAPTDNCLAVCSSQSATKHSALGWQRTPQGSLKALDGFS